MHHVAVEFQSTGVGTGNVVVVIRKEDDAGWARTIGHLRRIAQETGRSKTWIGK